MKEKIVKNKRIIITTLSLIVFFLILKDIFEYEITSYDNWAYSFFVESLRSDNMTTIMKIITSFGSAFMIITILILLLIFIKDKYIAIFSSINILFVLLLNNFIKVIVQRPRPTGYNLIVESFYSFPSGHSMVSTAFYGLLIYYIYKKEKDKLLKYILITILFLLIVLICISRIYLGVHYLSDTVAGFSLSIAYLMLFTLIIPKLTERLDYEFKKRKKEKI